MRRGKWLWALAAAIVAPLLMAAAPAQAADNGPSLVPTAAAPYGANGLAVVDEATAKALEPQLRNGSDAVAPQALCNQQSYVQVFDPATRQALITLAPGGTLNVHAFTVVRHQGVTYPGTRAIFQYRWAGGIGFDYFTTFSEGNCVMREEPNSLSAQNFPVGQTSVHVCFVPWEIGQVVCGPLGTINRTF
jgi:hypothetical protein